MDHDDLINNASYIGTDESGKGDYFGPLVVASVLTTDETCERFQALDVRDSKRVTDKKARRIAGVIQYEIPCAVVAIGPQKYNELYARIKNLNRLLAWGHARAIENILDRCTAGLAVTDQFGDPRYVESALMKKGQKVELIQETKAERHIGVAAASILARARFLDYLDRFASEYDMTFPKGAGNNVDIAAADFCRKYGYENLDKVAKLHFKNSKKVSELLQHHPQ